MYIYLVWFYPWVDQPLDIQTPVWEATGRPPKHTKKTPNLRSCLNPYGMLDVNIYGHETTHGSTRILQEQDSVDRIRKALEEARRWVVHWRLSAVRMACLEFQGLCDKEMQALESFLQVYRFFLKQR